MSENLTLRITCSGDPIDQFEFYAGEVRTLEFQLMDSDTGLPFDIPDGAVKTLTLPSQDTADIEIADGDILVDVANKSIATVSLTTAHTNKLMTGFIKLQYVDGGTIRIAYKDFVIKKLTN